MRGESQEMRKGFSLIVGYGDFFHYRRRDSRKTPPIQEESRGYQEQEQEQETAAALERNLP